MILQKIFEYLMYGATCFFAAGAVSTSGGASTGTTAAIPGGSSGESGVGEGSSTSGSETGAKTGTDSHGEGTGEGDFGSVDDSAFEGASETGAQAGEWTPDSYQKLKTLLKPDPNLFKAAKGRLGKLNRFEEHFESPEQAGEFLGKVSSLGGIEAIEQEMGETATFLNGWNAGDREVIARWMDDNQDGVTAAMPHVIEKWRELDPNGWARDAAQTFIATMNAAGVGEISALAAINELGKVKEVAESPAYKKLVSVIQGIQRTADQQGERKEPKRDGQYDQREQRLNQREQSLRRQGLASNAAPVLNTEAAAALRIVIGTRKISPEHRKDLINDIHREFARLAGPNGVDKQGAKNRQQLLQAGQDEQWMRSVKSAASRLMPQAARNVWRRYAGIAGLSQQEKQARKDEGQSRREAGAGASQGSMKAAQPATSEIDWTRMREFFGGRDKAEDAFNGWLTTGPYAGKRVWLKKGDSKTVYTR